MMSTSPTPNTLATHTHANKRTSGFRQWRSMRSVDRTASTSTSPPPVAAASARIASEVVSKNSASPSPSLNFARMYASMSMPGGQMTGSNRGRGRDKG